MSVGKSLIFAPARLGQIAALTTAGGMILDAAGEKVAIRYIANTTSPITAVDMRWNISGAPGSFTIGVFADLNGAPDNATQLGTSTAAFAAPGASGWIGSQSLQTNTGNLTIGKVYWIVVSYSSGTISVTDYIQLMYSSTFDAFVERLRHYNGTNWTTTTAVDGLPLMILTHADSSYDGGIPVTAAAARSAAAPDVFVNAGTSQVQGIRFKSGSQVKILGVYLTQIKAGTPADLTLSVYEGDTLKYSVSPTVSEITTNAPYTFWFPSPVLLAANTNLYIIISQTGTSDTNDWDLYTQAINSAYISAILPDDFRFVYGSGNPSVLTVAAGEVPMMAPIIANSATDLNEAAVGGGGQTTLMGGM